MKQELKFKTNINCINCLKKVTPFLDKLDGIDSWSVDIDDPNKILVVKSNAATEQQIIEAVQKVGFEIERI